MDAQAPDPEVGEARSIAAQQKLDGAPAGGGGGAQAPGEAAARQEEGGVTTVGQTGQAEGLVGEVGGQPGTPEAPGMEPDEGALANLAGQVVDRAGDPVEGAEVEARGADGGPAVSTRTDASGAFSFQELAPGNYQVAAQKDGLKGETGPVAAVLDQPLAVLVVLGADASISGTVLDGASRDPVVGIPVIASERSRGTRSTVLTNQEGEFRVWLPGPGLFNLYSPGNDDYAESEDWTRVDLAQGEHKEGVDLFLNRGVTLEGTVEGEEGPVEGATVILLDLTAGHGGDEGDTLSDATGRFRFSGMKAGGRFVARGLHPEWGLGESKPVQTNEAGALERLDLRLVRGQRVPGRLVTRDGAGVPGLEVWLMPEGGHPWDPLPGTRVSSGKDGYFELPQVPEGRFQFVVTTSDLPQFQASAKLKGPVFSVVKGQEPAPVVVNLGRGVAGFLEGKVTSPEGAPLPEVEVMAWDGAAGLVSAARTDQEGLYRIDGLGPATILSMEVRGVHTGRVRKTRDGVAVDSRGVDFVLGAMGSLSGRAVDAATREGLSRFRVDGWLVQEEFQSPDGSFKLAELQVDGEEFRFSSPGYLDTVYTVQGSVEGLKLEGLIIELHKGSTLRARVRDEVSGAPVVGARATVLQPTTYSLQDLDRYGAWGPSDPISDQDGNFVLTVPSEGSPSNLLVWHPDYAPGLLLGNTRLEVDLVLGQGGSLQVFVTSDGAPAKGYWVHAVLQSGLGDLVLRKGGQLVDGGLNLERLPAGEYLVQVWAPDRDKPVKEVPARVVKGQALKVGLELVQ
jgi:protocatechuate 3,4-dioxygenase beta subunit